MVFLFTGKKPHHAVHAVHAIERKQQLNLHIEDIHEIEECCP
jgi:hypothetical protein